VGQYHSLINGVSTLQNYAYGFTAGVRLNFVKSKDYDGDNIRDNIDRCPLAPGIEKFCGCPDKDNDGVPDADDDCLNEVGPAYARGCPDRDGDGIPDKDDRCPGLQGLRSNKGCPAGYFEAKSTKLLTIGPAYLVNFPKDLSKLDPVAIEILKNIVTHQKNSNSEVFISGHDDEFSSQLAQERTDSIAEYLIRNGVARNKIVQKNELIISRNDKLLVILHGTNTTPTGIVDTQYFGGGPVTIDTNIHLEGGGGVTPVQVSVTTDPTPATGPVTIFIDTVIHIPADLYSRPQKKPRPKKSVPPQKTYLDALREEAEEYEFPHPPEHVDTIK
jgi:hypothetical protein